MLAPASAPRPSDPEVATVEDAPLVDAAAPPPPTAPTPTVSLDGELFTFAPQATARQHNNNGTLMA